ncbi:MAG: hypothetical protein Q8P42_13305 [Gallionella sp.]|nr:hypothetical protein [Gallionella sp.]
MGDDQQHTTTLPQREPQAARRTRVVDTLFEGKHFFSIFRTFNLKLE